MVFLNLCAIEISLFFFIWFKSLCSSFVSGMHIDPSKSEFYSDSVGLDDFVSSTIRFFAFLLNHVHSVNIKLLLFHAFQTIFSRNILYQAHDLYAAFLLCVLVYIVSNLLYKISKKFWMGFAWSIKNMSD